MPQIDFVLCEHERIQFIEFVFNKRCGIVPDRHYLDPNYSVQTSMEGYFQFCSTEPLLFLLSDKFSFYSLEMNLFEDNNKKCYYIKQRSGGPSIDFYSPILGEKENNLVGTGFIGVYPYYYVRGVRFSPGKELSESYKLFCSFIKKITIKVALSQKTYWVGKYTVDMAKKGNIQLPTISGINLLEKFI